MSLFVVRGLWSGTIKPEITTIRLVAEGFYEWDTVDYLVYDSTWSYKESSPVLHDDETWTFLVPETNIPPVNTGRKIGNASVVSYAEALNKSNIQVVVTYKDGVGASQTTDAILLVRPADFGRIRFAPGHSAASDPIFISSGDASFDIEYTIDPTKIRAGHRLAIYVEWTDFDTMANTYTRAGMVKKELNLDEYVGSMDFINLTETIVVPNGATRAKFFVIPYNINDLSYMDYAVPKSDNEVTVKGAGWHHVEQKYIRWISQEDYNALWEAAKAKPEPINPTRIAVESDNDRLYGGLVNVNNVCYISGSAGTEAERSSWDGEFFTKIFRGPNCCIAQRENGSTFGIGSTASAPLSHLATNPLPNDVVKVAMGTTHIAALKPDGTVIHRTYSGVTWHTAANSWTGIVDIAAGDLWTAGIKADGSIVVVKNGTNSYVDTGAFAGKILKKIYSMGTDHIIALDDTGKILISGTDSGIAGFRDIVNTWPANMTHISASNYRIYAFCKDRYQRQVWCTDPDEHTKLLQWGHLVAGTSTLSGFIGVRCDGQIMTTEWKSLQIRKKAGYPSKWVATPT